MDKNEKPKEVTGVWVFPNAEVLEDFFLKKAIKEKELGRVLTEEEGALLLADFMKRGEIDGFLMDGNKGDVQAILSEHFNVLKPKKSEE